MDSHEINAWLSGLALSSSSKCDFHKDDNNDHDDPPEHDHNDHGDPRYDEKHLRHSRGRLVLVLNGGASYIYMYDHNDHMMIIIQI